MSQLDKNITLMCAMRYALGRKTYVVGSVTNELIENWHHFKKGNQIGMVKEIRKAIEEEDAGMECDVKMWIAVINHSIKHSVNTKDGE